MGLAARAEVKAKAGPRAVAGALGRELLILGLGMRQGWGVSWGSGEGSAAAVKMAGA